ncbi:MAG: Uma2 family endonuclease [Myxococcales bacterium]|nr:Uma2 family endonuclease [Myxococcales bacterium]
MTAVEPMRMSYAEYLEYERQATLKHEYLRGEVFAMTGGTPQHSALAARMTAVLTRELGGRPCRVFNADLRVRIEATDLAAYPDVSVVCDRLETAADDELAVINPVLLVEVLSDSTEAYDRGQKAAHYRRIPSLRAYLLVSQHEPRLELLVRKDDGTWTLLEATVGERLPVEPLAVELSVDEIYEDPLARG